MYFNFGNQAHVKRSFGPLFTVGSKEWWCVWFIIAAAAFMGFCFRSRFLSFSYPCSCCITIFHLPFFPLTCFLPPSLLLSALVIVRGRIEAFFDTVLLVSFDPHLLRHVLFFPPSFCEPVSSLRIELSFRCFKSLLSSSNFQVKVNKRASSIVR